MTSTAALVAPVSCTPRLASLGLFALLTFVGFGAAPAEASTIRAADKLGVGFGHGFGTWGASGKYWLTDSAAVQANVGYGSLSLEGAEPALGINAAYLVEGPELRTSEALDLGWNVGGGAAVGLGPEPSFGIMGVAGLELCFKKVPMDIVVEAQPGVRLLPSPSVHLASFGAQARFWF